MPSSYVPDLGDIIWLDFDPSAGHAKIKLLLKLT